MSEISLAKATITNMINDDVLEVLFNPSEYILSKQTVYSEKEETGKNTTFLQFAHGRRRQLRVELFFDTTDDGRDVSEYTEKLESFMELQMDESGKSQNPLLIFEWGSLKFECVLEDLKLQFTKFSAGGVPLRVIARAVFSEYVPLGGGAGGGGYSGGPGALAGEYSSGPGGYF